MMRRSCWLRDARSVLRLADLPEVLPAATPLPAGSVVLRMPRTAEPPASQYRVQRQQLKNSVDVFARHRESINNYDKLREVPGLFLSHTPLTVAGGKRGGWVTMLLPTEQLACKLGYTPSVGGDAAGVEYSKQAVNAALRSVFRPATRVTRTASVVSSTTGEVLLHPRFDSVESVMSFLRSRGNYLPCVTHADELYVDSEVARAFADGYVSVNPKLGGTEPHARSLQWLFSSGFGLHLPGINVSQLGTFRLQHGGEECILLGQRLAFYYKGITTDPHTGVVNVQVQLVDSLPVQHATHVARSTMTRLLLKETDFEQAGDPDVGAWSLLRRSPPQSRHDLQYSFDAYIAKYSAWLDAASQPRGRSSRNLNANVMQAIAELQKQMPNVDFSGKLAAAVAKCAPAFETAAQNRVTVHGPRTMDDATAEYLRVVATVLVEEVTAARDDALAHYDALSKGTEAGSHASWPEELLADAVTEKAPFYGNLVA